LRFRPSDRVALLNTLEKDVEMLERLNIMDYSLLFAVEQNPHYKARHGPTSQIMSTTSEEGELNLKGKPHDYFMQNY
jgi:hypothetical protein